MPPTASVSTREAYALWAPTYPPAAHNPLMRTEQEAVLVALAGIRPARALDVGTGSGRYLPALAAAGAGLVVGLDFSPEMLARASCSGHRVCADARRLPFAGGTFDLINASLMAGDVTDLDAFARELAGALGPGGHLLYSDFHPSWATYGWRRTFQTADGTSVDLPFVTHPVAAHERALRHAGLDVLACRELPLAHRDDPATRAFRRRWGNPPVLVLVHGRKARP